MRLVETAGLYNARLLAHARHVLRQPVGRRSRDHRPQIRLEISRIADYQLIHRAGDHFDYLLGYVILQE